MSFHNYLTSLHLILFFGIVHASAFTTQTGFTFSWRNCGASSDPIQLKDLAITPDPIRVPGNVTVTGSADVAIQIPTDVHVSVLLERKVGPFFVKVPCVDNFGSCNYANACDLWAQFCPKYAERYGLPCQCPIPANTYSVSNANIFVNVSPPAELLGEYRATAAITSQQTQLGCIVVDVTVRK